MKGTRTKGRTELVYLSDDLFELGEEVRKKLGLSRSGFYRYCILKTLDSLNILSTRANQRSKTWRYDSKSHERNRRSQALG